MAMSEKNDRQAPDRVFIAWPNDNGCGLAFTVPSKAGQTRTEFVRADAATPPSAGTLSVEPALPVELTAAQLDDACMSHRHDHGLLSADQREDRRREAADWWRCLRKTIAEPSPALRALAGEEGK